MYFHSIYYNGFTCEYQKKSNVNSFSETAILHYVPSQIELKVIKDYEAFLVNELMQDIREISEEHGLEEPSAGLRHSSKLKEKPIEHFGKKIQFTNIEKQTCTALQ